MNPLGPSCPDNSIPPILQPIGGQPCILSFPEIRDLQPDMSAASAPSPGILALLLFPYTLISNIYSCYRACRNGDGEEGCDAALRLASMPFYALQNAIFAGSTALQVASFF